MRYLSNKETFNVLSRIGIERFIINNDGSVDVDGNVTLPSYLYHRLPIQFRKVTGSFYCNGLKSLEGSPTYVGCNFYCDSSGLTSLFGAPEIIVGNFDCYHNRLTTLEGAPKEVGGNFNCSDNRLISLVGSPRYVGKSFYCYDNNLTTYVGGPVELGGEFYGRSNPMPQEIFDNYKDIKYILQYQNMYSIWRKDGSLDPFRFQEMMKDIDI